MIALIASSRDIVMAARCQADWARHAVAHAPPIARAIAAFPIPLGGLTGLASLEQHRGRLLSRTLLPSAADTSRANYGGIVEPSLDWGCRRQLGLPKY